MSSIRWIGSGPSTPHEYFRRLVTIDVDSPVLNCKLGSLRGEL